MTLATSRRKKYEAIKSVAILSYISRVTDRIYLSYFHFPKINEILCHLKVLTVSLFHQRYLIFYQNRPLPNINMKQVLKYTSSVDLSLPNIPTTWLGLEINNHPFKINAERSYPISSVWNTVTKSSTGYPYSSLWLVSRLLIIYFRKELQR